MRKVPGLAYATQPATPLPPGAVLVLATDPSRQAVAIMLA